MVFGDLIDQIAFEVSGLEVQVASRVIGKRRIDLESDPLPDVVVRNGPRVCAQ